MTQIQQHHVAPLQTRIVEIEGRFYQVQVSEMAHPQPQIIQPQPITTGVSIPPSPYITPRQFPIYLALGAGCMAIALFGSWVFVRLVMPPVPASPAPPQTVIVQPPVAEKKPYSRRECKHAGALGWGQDCYEEKGYE